MSPTTLPELTSRGGIHLSGTELWFDAETRRALSFVSSAVMRRPAAHRTTLCSDQTAKLLAGMGRRQARRAALLTAPYSHPFRLGPLKLEMLPAGGLIGNAQLLVRRHGVRILYTGELTLERLPLAPPATATHAALVIARAWIAGPNDDDRTRMEDNLLRFAEEQLSAGRCPILVAAVPASVEIVDLFARHALPCKLHRTVERATEAFRSCGAPLAPLDSRPGKVAVEIWPATATHTKSFRERTSGATAGVALVGREPPENARANGSLEPLHQNRFIWHAHPTATALVDWLVAAEPERVALYGPDERHMQQMLAERGVEAVALSESGQLHLTLE